MLVLTRKLNESIKIGNDITVTVIRIGRSAIKIGVQAPEDVHIIRSEKLDKENTDENRDL